MSDISPTINLIDSALGQGTAPPAQSTAAQAISTIDAGLVGKLPESTKPYETTAKGLVLNTESGANSALASTLGAPVDLVNAGLRKLGLPVSETPVGGSESIKQAMGLINANPDAVVPQNEAERIAHGVGEGAGSAVLLPIGGEALAAGKVISPATADVVRSAVGAPDALNATIGAAGGAGSTVAADAVPEPYKPLAATVGGLAAGTPVVAGHALYEGARAGVQAITDRLTEEGAKKVVGKEMANAATDQGTARENLATQPHEIIPGSVGTTAQVAGDTGLLDWERGVRQQNAAAFNDREAAQNAAQTAHLESVQPTGNAADLPGVLAGQREAAARAAQANTGVVDALSAASVKSAEGGQKSALEGLKTLAPDASPAEVSAHFRDQREALDRSTQAAVDQAETAAQTARGQIPANRPEDVGAALRAPAQEARNAAKEQESALWRAVDPDGTLSVGMGPIQQAKNAIYGNLTKAAEAGISPAERSLGQVIDEYKPVESFKELTDLRSSVSSAMREELRNSGRTPAYARLTQLRQGVENAIDGAVEGRAVQEQGAVARGDIPEEEAIANRLRNWVDEFSSRRSGEVSTGNGRAVASSGGPGASSLSRTEGETGARSGGAAGNSAGPQPNLDTAAPGRLRAASQATQARKQTFDEGAAGKLLKPGARAGEYRATNAQAPATVFHPGPTGGEDVRAYINAAGDAAIPALTDAAAMSARAAAGNVDGSLNPAKLTAWAQKHEAALAELPESVRARFDNAANAETAIAEATAARRDAIETFNKSAAGKIAGLKDPGDIVREVGSIISSKDGAKRMGEFADAAKDNPAAKEGLQRAVVEHVMNKFVPDNLEKAQSFIQDKADVLGKVFSPEEIDGITKKIEAAQSANARVESAKANRETALKEAQASEKETLSRYDSTILGKIMKTEGTANVLDKLGSIFGSSDSTRQMGLLADEAAKVSGGTDALRKAVTEMIKRDVSTTAEAGTSGQLGLSRAALAKFMKENTETLEKVLSPEQVGKLRAIVEDQLRTNRSITATKLKGGSDTNQNQIAASKTGGTILSAITKHAAESGATLLGAMLGGPGGALVGQIGSKAMSALRDAGLNRVNEIRIRAALDPEFGKALLDEVPKHPDRNAAALIALRAKQLSVAGTMAGIRQH